MSSEVADHASSQTLPPANMLWGVKSSFRRYVARMPDGVCDISREVTTPGEGQFGFPLAGFDQGSFEPIGADLARFETSEVVRYRFDGAIRFSAHGGVLDVHIAEPWLDRADDRWSVSCLSGEGEHRVVLAVGATRLTGVPVAEKQTRAADVEVVDLILAPRGTDLFAGNYPPGEELDPLFLMRPVESRDAHGV
jgi:hypothetical protein